MAELLKNRYNYKMVQELAVNISAVYPTFKVTAFVNDIINQTGDSLELKARMRQITLNLGKYLPANYEQALAIIDKVVANYPAGFNDFTLMSFPDFVEVYGQNEADWDLSIAALARYTTTSTSEFAVRPFMINHEKAMLKVMLAGAKDKNEHVRRLASEGSRPQLPWGQALVSFKTNPLPILPILEQLKTDSSLYVRKSVANSLNDISKTHPELVIKIAQEGYGNNKDTDGIVKHASRTLLKKGNKEVLEIFGVANSDCLNISDFILEKNTVKIGENIAFAFKITTHNATKIRVEYGIDYLKANGKSNRKVFHISEITLKANEQKTYTKKHSFANVTTRKHYLGNHTLTLIVNGTEYGTFDFQLVNN